ncbi:MAG: hypothetical protein ACM3H8_08635 [Sphingobacteriales bacterium]
MNIIYPPRNLQWSSWQKIAFRFFFIYILLYIAPWTWISDIPGTDYVLKYYSQFMDWLVNWGNSKLFHVREVLVPFNGSGDTSYGWAQLLTFISLALIGCMVWSIADRKRSNYNHLSYWLCLFTRYNLILFCFLYGIDKLFLLQMPFPNYSQLATPLGDFLPMRLSWMFMGYSGPYQLFAGLMEVFAGILLLFRRTATFGTIVATGVFINVIMMNLSYDIPVKLFSTNLVVLCLFLLANDHKRIITFFVMNKPSASCSLYDISFTKKWMRISRVFLKIAFIGLFVFLQGYNMYGFYKQRNKPMEVKLINPGVYNVNIFAINQDTLPPLLTDTLRWQDMIFEKDGQGSINTMDTSFRRRYRRAYFNYEPDTVKHIIGIKKFSGDSVNLIAFNYLLSDSNTIRLWGKLRSDSLYVELKRSKRHFQLAEKQFHWLSESNR